MADSQRDVKNRIASVQNIEKITRAMQMVAAARLRRAEQRIEALRPYAGALRRTTRAGAAARGGAGGDRGIGARRPCAGAIRRMTRQAAEAAENVPSLPILKEH